MESHLQSIQNAINSVKQLPPRLRREHENEIRGLKDQIDSLLHVAESKHPVTEVLTGLNSSREEIYRYLNQNFKDAVPDVDWKKVDFRILDIEVASGTKRLTPGKKFRRGLALRSLTLQYDKWEVQSYGTSRLSRLKSDIAKYSDRDGLISKFIYAHNFGEDFSRVKNAIHEGTKTLVLEHLARTSGISPIMYLLLPRKLRPISYKSLPELITELNQSEWLDLARDRHDWFQACVGRYDGKSSSAQIVSPSTDISSYV